MAMGVLIYNGATSIPIDDRTLAHLQVVMTSKLRRNESFTFTAEVKKREMVFWVTQTMPLEFVYSGNRSPALNRTWLELLAERASSNAGLTIEPEPYTKLSTLSQTQVQSATPVSPRTLESKPKSDPGPDPDPEMDPRAEPVNA